MSKKAEILNKLQEKFFAELDTKPSWGKEQLKKKYLEIKTQILTESLDKEKDATS
jgi:hypothetical protein